MVTPLRVLMAGDSADEVLFIMEELRRGGYEAVFKRVETSEAMKAALEGGKWDIIISYYMMAQFGGLEALQVLKETRTCLSLLYRERLAKTQLLVL